MLFRSKEQESKIARSGLKQYFSSIEIMSEKHSVNYMKIVNQHNLKPSEFLMVGNSFKSDILPALEIGAYAVYIPSEITWAHEVVDETEHPMLMKITELSELLNIFEI